MVADMNSPKSSPGQHHILIVDDSELDQQITRAMLENTNSTFASAYNGQQAVEIVQKEDFDLVLMDIQMPVMDGIEASRQIRLTHPRLPIIALSASTRPHEPERCLSAGMNSFMSKPIDSERLIFMLEQWLPRQRSQRITPSPIPQSVDTQTLPDLPGLSVQQGIDHCGGNPDFYLRMLTKFLKTKLDINAELQDLLQQRKQEEASRLAHSMRSVAGNIGAERLAQHATDLENALQQSSHSHDLPALPLFEHELHTIIEGLDHYFSSGQSPLKTALGDISPSTRRALLCRLFTLLETHIHDAPQQKPWLEQNFASPIYTGLLKQYDLAIAQQDIHAAQDILIQLAQKAGIPPQEICHVE